MNNEKPLSTDAEILKGLRTKEVLDDLDEKFGRTTDANDIAPEPQSVSSIAIGTKRVLDELERNTAETLKALEGLPTETITIPSAEMTQLRELQQWLDGFKTNFEINNQSLEVGSAAYTEAANEAIKDVESFLDSLSLWKSKFSTTAGGSRTELELTNWDSRYYLTNHGVSLRIRRASIRDSLPFKHAIQPFAEITLFSGLRIEQFLENFIPRPEIGRFVRDYISNSFSEALREPNRIGDFTSPACVVMKDSLPVCVFKPAGVHEHNGDPVNHIFFNRS